jgi:hypothetical protein
VDVWVRVQKWLALAEPCGPSPFPRLKRPPALPVPMQARIILEWPIFRSLDNQLIFCAADMRTSLNAGEGIEISTTIAKANLVWIDSCYAAARFLI